MPTNHMAVLANRPVGRIRKTDFEVRQAPVPALADGQILVRVKVISLDPAMRGWVQDVKSYLPPVQIGEVMRAGGAGIVEASNNPKFKVGDAVTGVFGVQEYAVSDGKAVAKVDPSIAPLETWIGGLGMPGMTAYFGLLEVGQPKAGETVVVSAASGAVGSIVGQIAKIKGCRVVGIAGGPDKCRYVVEDLGFDACVDYKAGNLRQQLKAACPDGIDVNFENVGGEILDTILPMMNLFGRIAVCGLISEYNATEMPDGVKNFRVILVKRLRVQGLIVFDWAKRYHEGVAELVRWRNEGRLKLKEDVRDGGVAKFAETVDLLFSGGNFGKLVLKV